jgi:antitoxin ParD1/3/4
MIVTLTAEQQAWLESQVELGEFASVDEAVSQIVAERMLQDDDLAWAKPLVDEALESVARGELMTLEEHRARNAERLARLTGKNAC